MTKPFPHSREPFDTPPERPMSMTFDTGLSYDSQNTEYSLTFEVLHTGAVLLVGDPMDHPLEAFGREDAELFRANARLFNWLADVLETEEAEEEEATTPATPPKTQPAQPDLLKIDGQPAGESLAAWVKK